MHRQAHTIVLDLSVERLIWLEYFGVFGALFNYRPFDSLSKFIKRVLVLQARAEILVNLVELG